MVELIVTHLPRLFLFVCASAFLYYGSLGLVNPAATVFPLGITVDSAAATTEIRATYGGLLIGIGLFLFYAGYAENKVGLVSFVLMISAIGLTRLYGIYSDGSNSTIQWTLLTMEVVPAAIALALLARYYVLPNGGAD